MDYMDYMDYMVTWAGGLEGWRAGGLEGWMVGGLEDWRAGGLEGWRVGGVGGLEGLEGGRVGTFCWFFSGVGILGFLAETRHHPHTHEIVDILL